MHRLERKFWYLDWISFLSVWFQSRSDNMSPYVQITALRRNWLNDITSHNDDKYHSSLISTLMWVVILYESEAHDHRRFYPRILNHIYTTITFNCVAACSKRLVLISPTQIPDTYTSIARNVWRSILVVMYVWSVSKTIYLYDWER